MISQKEKNLKAYKHARVREFLAMRSSEMRDKISRGGEGAQIRHKKNGKTPQSREASNALTTEREGAGCALKEYTP